MSGNPWSERELEILRQEYPFKKTGEIEALSHRPKSSIITKASDMGIKKNPGFWKKSKCLPKIGWQDKYDSPEIGVRPIGENETIPKMPCCLLWHLKEMEGCMDSAVVMPHAGQRAFVERFEKVRPKIEEMLRQKIKYADIANEIGMSYYTVFEYAKKIRAAA